jgi:tetratricopeptide (TPR) repeat protein
MPDTEYKIIESLEKALKAGQVIPFVGAGVSRAVEKKDKDSTKSFDPLFPSWKEYVEILAETLIKDGQPNEGILVNALVNSTPPKYLEAMQHAFEKLGAPLWFEKLNEYFKVDESKADENALELPRLIWQLGSNVVFTTNIDRVLEWRSVKDGTIDILDTQKVESAELQREKDPPPTIIYLHGRVGDKEHIVFTREQYDNFYKNRGNEAKLRTLQAFLTTKSFLFIGFSLDDAYFVEQLHYIHEIYKGGASRYFALIKKSDEGKLSHLSFVKEVYFEDFGEPLLKALRKMRDVAVPPMIPPEPALTPSNINPKKDGPFFNVPYNSKGKEFVGRAGKREEIRDLLNQDGCAAIGQAVSVKGFGGLGKTQLAVEYAHAYRDKYKNGVFWLVADQPVDNQLLQIGDELGWTANVSETVNQLDAAKNGFRALRDCLILFDNVETFAGIKDYLPKPDKQTHILITTREKIGEFRPINLDLLERDESRELVLKISGRSLPDETERAPLEKILEILGDIPLAIELVGGYLAEHPPVTFAKYHQFLNEVPLDQLEKEFPEGSFTNHDRSIIQTLRISEKTVNEKPLMVEILKVLAWSGSSSMGISLLQTLVEPEDDFKFETALGEAVKLRLIKKDEDADRYAVHRLLAKVVRHENPLEKQKKWHGKISASLEDWFNARENKFEKLAEFESEIEHLEIWQEKTLEILPANAVVLLQLMGNVPHQRGLYLKAFNYFEEALRLYQRKGLSDKNILADLQNNLGNCYGYLGDHQEALRYQLQALEIRRELSGEKHPDTVSSLNNVGFTYRELGDHQEALKYLLQAFKISHKSFGEKHPDTATSLNNIGSTYSELGNHQKALKHQLWSLKIRYELFGEKHSHTATSLNDVGITYDDLGDYGEALKYQLQALEIYCELFGEKHPYTAISLNNVGFTYCKLGDHRESVKYLEKALVIYQELLGTQHPNSIIFAKNLIITYLKLGDKEKAGEKAAETFNDVPQDTPYWKWFEETSRPYRKKKNRHKKGPR